MKSSPATRFVMAVLCGGLVASAAVPAGAALFDDTEARQRIELTNQRIDQLRRLLEDRIAAVETQVKNQGLVDIFNQIEQLKREMAQLRGQLEVIAYELGEAQKRQRDLYVDLDSRMRRLESAGSATGSTQPRTAPAPAPQPTSSDAAVDAVNAGNASGYSAGAASATGPAPSFGPPPANAGGLGARPGPDSAGEQRAYDSALDLFKAGNYGAAVQSFAAFVRNFPRSALAPSAQYWIGNAQYAQRDFRGAIGSQRQLISTYPDSQKVPDAVLNIATSQFELGDTVASRRTLEELVARYPQSDAAAKARQRLTGR
ncbi:MAG: tol-pal system protein YbgF [Casimicrobiaceae bacterium]